MTGPIRIGIIYLVEALYIWEARVERPFPAYRGDDDFIFVCYAHEDSEFVYPEIAWLHDEGLNLWYDEGNSPGRNWRSEIGLALDRAAKVLFYISPNSLKSHHCNREINYALDEGKDIVPVYLESMDLTPDLKIGLNRVQALHRSSMSARRYGRPCRKHDEAAGRLYTVKLATPIASPDAAVDPFETFTNLGRLP